MHKIINQIRDIKIIEEELVNSPAGILALICDSDKITQLTKTYLYMDKNIYVFFHKDDELFDNIQWDTSAIFTIFKPGKIKKTNTLDFEPTYDIFSITVRGILKKIDDPKLIEEAKNNYVSKYKKQKNAQIDYTNISKVVLIDTEEIHASEETGG